MRTYRSRRWMGMAVGVAALVTLAVGGATLAQNDEGYALRWWTVDGGGTTLTRVGEYTLGGTAGQPEAGTLRGPDYTLRGGFWGGGFGTTSHLVMLPLVLRTAAE